MTAAQYRPTHEWLLFRYITRRVLRAVLVGLLLFLAITLPSFQRMHDLSVCVARELGLDSSAKTVPWDTILSDPGYGQPSDPWYRPPRHPGTFVEVYTPDHPDCR